MKPTRPAFFFVHSLGGWLVAAKICSSSCSCSRCCCCSSSKLSSWNKDKPRLTGSAFFFVHSTSHASLSVGQWQFIKNYSQSDLHLHLDICRPSILESVLLHITKWSCNYFITKGCNTANVNCNILHLAPVCRQVQWVQKLWCDSLL